MKNIIIMVLIFGLGFFAARFFIKPQALTEQESIEAVEQEVYQPQQAPKPNPDIQQVGSPSDENIPSASRPAKTQQKEVSTPKLERINDKLDKLDQEIAKKLNKLEDLDPEYGAKLKKEIHQKSTEPFPGDDKFSEKEYQNENQDNLNENNETQDKAPGADDLNP